MPLAYSYRRWSSAEQSKGTSRERQTSQSGAASWCARNGYQLDTSLRMEDAGVSAFKGKNLENPDVHALAGFYAAVKSGRVPESSALVVESFDRISRQEIRLALPKILDLVNAGIKVVQLQPETVLDKTADMTAIVMLVLTLSRGNNESAVKSFRAGAAWDSKRKNAATTLVTKRVSNWLKVVGGKVVIIPERAEVVKRIFALTASGLGVYAIAKIFNGEKVPTFGAAMWTEPIVHNILTNRATIGEFQLKDGNRKPSGEPLPNYFPAVITAAEFHAAEKSRMSRKNFGGRKGTHVNLFSGLLRDCRTGGSMTFKHTKGNRPAIIPVGKGSGGIWSTFPADVFELAILNELVELPKSSILPDTDDSRKVEQLSGKVAEAEANCRKLKDKMDTDPELLDLLADKLKEWEVKRRKLVAELTDAQREAASPLSESWGRFQSIGEEVLSNQSEALRQRVQTELRRVVKRVHCLFLGGKFAGTKKRVALVLVEFHGSEQTRFYAVDWWPANSNGKAVVEGERVYLHSAQVAQWGKLDMRNVEDIPTIEEVYPLGK